MLNRAKALSSKPLAVIKKSVNRRIEMETAFMSLCSPELDKSNDALLSRISELEAQVRMLKTNGVKASPIKEKKEEPEVKPVNEKAPGTEDKPKTENKEEKKAPEQKEEPVNEEPKEEKSGGEKPFDRWPEAVKLACSVDVPLIGFLTGTSAVIKDNVVFIKSDNPVLASFLQQENHTKVIRGAIFKVTGEKYRLGIYNDKKNAPATPKKDPLDGFMEMAQGLGINVERKE